MNKPQNVRRPRGRGPKRGTGGNPGGNRGGNVSRGNPRQLLDKYKALAREAMQAGERVLAEYYYQHADHYQRVLNERTGVYNGPDDDEDEADDDEADGFSPSRDRRPRRSRSERAAEADLADRPQPRLADAGNGTAPAAEEPVAARNGGPSDAGGDEPAAAAEPRPRRRRRPTAPKPAAEGSGNEGDSPA